MSINFGQATKDFRKQFPVGWVERSETQPTESMYFRIHNYSKKQNKSDIIML